MADLSEIQAAQSVKVIGSDLTGTETTPMGVDTNGSAQVILKDGSGATVIAATSPSLSASAVVTRPIPFEVPTYSATASGFVCAAAATDVFTITGSATKTIRVTKFKISGTTTSGTAIKCNIQLIKRSTVDSAGTRVADTPVSYDSTNAAATATVGHYTANPTVGTLVGILRADANSFSTTGVSGGIIEWHFSDSGQPIVLRGISEQLAVNFNATTITGPVISIVVEWEEV